MKISKDEFLRLVDNFINDEGIWPDFVLYAEGEGHDIESDTPLDQQVEFTD